MNFFLLTHSFPIMYKKISLYHEPESEEMSCSLSTYLHEIKEQIQHHDSWDIFKEYTNPYEYIHTKTPNKKSVSSYQPLSRSYFKMIELLKQFNILEKYKSTSIQTFHLAEGPGGFTEAVVNTRKQCLPSAQDKYYAISLINEENKTVPSWRKSQTFVKNNPQFTIEYGYDKTGNLLHMENFTDLVSKHGSQMEFVTGDGGFDFSDDFNRQELCILPLLVAQICYALCLQKKEGTFVLKIFDCFLKPTVDLLYLLSSFYEKVYLTKPLTSRMANSEKYLVCENFHFENYTEVYPYLFYLMKTTTMMKSSEWTPCLRFLRMSIPRLFVSKLEEYNLILGHQQINNIFTTLSLINNKTNKNSKMDYFIRMHITKCIYWCQKHNVLVDKFFL